MKLLQIDNPLGAMFVVAVLLMPTAAHGEAGPSFDCDQASTPDEQAICNDIFFLPWLDAKMDRLWLEALERAGEESAKADELKSQQRAWLEKRRDCRESWDCLASVYMARLQILAAPHERSGALTSFYRYDALSEGHKANEDSDTGMVAIVSRPNNRLSGFIQTVTGPSYHLCNIRFEDAERIGEHYLWRSKVAESDGEFCRILIQVDENHGIEVDSLDCSGYCGARGFFDHAYRRE